jgi:hypothetical protein
MTRVFIIAALLALTTGCHSSDYDTKVFDPWCCENAEDLKARWYNYTNVLLVCVYEDHWEDRGPHKLSLHHYKGTVVPVYKGDWCISDKIAFEQGLDYRAPTNPTSCIGNLEFVFTSEHRNSEISLDTGELWICDEETAPALDRIYPQKINP